LCSKSLDLFRKYLPFAICLRCCAIFIIKNYNWFCLLLSWWEDINKIIFLCIKLFSLLYSICFWLKLIISYFFFHVMLDWNVCYCTFFNQSYINMSREIVICVILNFNSHVYVLILKQFKMNFLTNYFTLIHSQLHPLAYYHNTLTGILS